MAKIALALERALHARKSSGGPGGTTPRVLAAGDGWRVADVVCTSGPRDRPFEEQHARYSVAVVLAGSFQYRSSAGQALMTPGSIMLGSPEQRFECGHEHGDGDRCASFSFDAGYFERIVSDSGHRGGLRFAIPRIPPVRATASVVASVMANVAGTTTVAWNEIGVALAAGVATLARGEPAIYRTPPGSEARVTRAVRAIDGRPHEALTLDAMAAEAGLSPFHFLRTFERVTGVTPHQYILRARLRAAALRLASGDERILEVALACGFGDASNFNRTFRAEFGVTPREYRLRSR